MKRDMHLTIVFMIVAVLFSVQGATAQCECELTPNATIVSKGELLEFEATVTNNTENSGFVYFATKITLPDESTYPASGYLDGPIKMFLNPYQSRSKDISHIIPMDWSIGNYVYHGYVGRSGLIYHECEFDFEVEDYPHKIHKRDPRGPQLGEFPVSCPVCHSDTDFSIFKDGQPLADTTVCDPCHSPGGAFDGVGDLNPGNPDSVAYGAKYNWDDGIYEESGDTLKPGKEGWCAGCHDDGTSVINGVSAPNMMGDNVTYGYYASGHGEHTVVCEDCHELSFLHIDGNARTYSAALNNYRDGYRLNEDMAVPRDGEIHPEAFRLCINCHVYTEITGPYSNFRDDLMELQYHLMHLENWPNTLFSDSDFDGNCSGDACIDSAITCVNCHNVHGSPTPAMIRHGELISTPGTSDKVPALNFRWYELDGVTETDVLQDSRWGYVDMGYGVSDNHICNHCHAQPTASYYRIPGGNPEIVEMNIWMSNLNDVTQYSFSPGEDIRYHVSFRVGGAGPTYWVKMIRSGAYATSGTYWETPLSKLEELAPGIYHWSVDRTIPPGATPGSSARFRVELLMGASPTGPLLDAEMASTPFSIVP